MVTLILIAFVEECHRNFVPGTTVDCKLEVRTKAGVLTDLDADPTADIRDPQGTIVVTDGVTTKESTGIYSYKYVSSATGLQGTYRVTFKGENNSNSERQSANFIIRQY